MYILIIARGYPDSQNPMFGIFEFDQAKALQDFGHKVVYISLDLRSIIRRRRFGKYWTQKEGVEILNLSIPLGKLPKPLNHFIGKQGLKFISSEVLKYGIPDIIHAHFTGIGHMASVLKEKFNIPLVITEHSSHINKLHLTKSLKRYALKAYTKADKVITVSSALKKVIFNHFNIESDIVHNIVDTNEFGFFEKQKTNSFTFIAVGSLNYNKGFDILISAFKRADFDKNVQLKIIGKGIESIKLQRQIDILEINDQVQLLGSMNRNGISKVMKECDVFVLASRSETFGVVYIEAMLTGLPVIATRCGGPEDFVDSKNGILVPVNDVNALAEALKSMFQSISIFNRKAISTKCREDFSPIKIANQLTEIYQKVLNYIPNS